MTHFSPRYLFSVGSTIILLAAVLACGGDSLEPIVIELNEEDAEKPDAGTEDVGIDDAQMEIEEEVEPPAQLCGPTKYHLLGPWIGYFQKPSESQYEPLTDVWTTDQFSHLIGLDSRYRGVRSRASTHPHMRTTRGFLQSFLYEGEYFVYDSSIFHYNYDNLLEDTTVVVLNEGRPLPFRYVEVENQFPSMEEIESWDREEFYFSKPIRRKNETAHNYSLVIPPWAFPEKGAYNIQFLLIPEWIDYPLRSEIGSLSGSGSIVGATLASNRSFTIFYGSAEFQRPSARYASRQCKAEQWDSILPRARTVVDNYNFLAPPRDLCDWHEWDPDSHPYPFWLPCLTEIHTVDEPTVELQLHVAAAGPDELHSSDLRGTNMYYIMRDHEVIDIFYLHPGEDVAYRELLDGEKKGLVVPLEVELTDEAASYSVVIVPDPWVPLELGEGLPFGRQVLVSNALLMQYVNPDKR